MNPSPGPLGALKRGMIRFSLDHPRLVVAVTVLVTVIAGLQLPRVKIDTDPENMLQADEPVRVLHDEIRETFALRDFLVVGVVSEDGVFRPDVLQRVAGLTEHLLEQDGVIVDDVLAPTEVDIIRGAGGTVDVSRLMETAPETQEEAEEIHRNLIANPVLRGKLGSDDGLALALYIPLEAKEYADEVAKAVHEWTAAH
ncbi:MAG: RND transporter, partial [Gemmatimonadetes bacterium]|nr:RND transporter [Gemmatimonadota bacterium]